MYCWFAGAQLESRVCAGDCSHETFSLEQKLETTLTRYDGSKYELEPEGEFRDYTNQDGTQDKNPENEIGKYFQCTKTAYKPYDLAVTVCLVIAKHHLRENITVHSDGTMENWHEAMQLCHHFLGYGKGFCLDDDGSVPLDATDSNAMVTQYSKNKKEIASLRKAQEKLEEEQEEKISKIKERYRDVIRELENQQYIETGKLQEIQDSAKKDTDKKTEELLSPISQTDRIVYYLKRNNLNPDTKCFESVKNRQDEHLELLEEYSDSCISLQMYLTENGRPINKYSLAIVGHSILGENRYDSEKILELPYGYFGWRNSFDFSGGNIKVDAKQFKTIEDAKKYGMKNNIRSILKNFFKEYDTVKSEYDEANSKYAIADFEEIVRANLSRYWNYRCHYNESEKKETAKKLGIPTIEISKMSIDQVLLLAERYGV